MRRILDRLDKGGCQEKIIKRTGPVSVRVELTGGQVVRRHGKI